MRNCFARVQHDSVDGLAADHFHRAGVGVSAGCHSFSKEQQSNADRQYNLVFDFLIDDIAPPNLQWRIHRNAPVISSRLHMLSGQMYCTRVSEIVRRCDRAKVAPGAHRLGLQPTKTCKLAVMAMHDLVPLDQALLPSNLAIAFGLEQPETDVKVESKPSQLSLLPPGNAAQPAWPVQGGFMPMPGPMPQAAPALHAGQMPPPVFEQQLNSAAMGSQQQLHGRSVQQGGQQASAGPQRTAGQSAPAAAATAGRTDNKDTAAVAMTKKPRVAWTSELHKRFVDAVTELGVHTAVPKAIMQVG
jgi:hypothetical protein